MRWKWTIVAVALLAAACGGGDDDDGGLLDRLDAASDQAETADTAAEPAEHDAAPAETEPDPDPSGEDRSAELVGTWRVTFYALPNGGGRTNVIEGDQPVRITFTDEGGITFHTGCNAGDATYTTSGEYVVPESALDDQPEGQPISIALGSSEYALCTGFLGEQNVDLPAAWRQATRFRIDENRLILSAEFFLVEAERT